MNEYDMEHWWNDNNRAKLRHWEKSPSQCNSVHHKSHMDWLRIKPRPPHWQQHHILENHSVKNHTISPQPAQLFGQDSQLARWY